MIIYLRCGTEIAQKSHRQGDFRYSSRRWLGENGRHRERHKKLPRLSQLLPRPQLSRRKNHSRLAKLEQRAGPPPVKKEWAHGSIEWLTEQEKARSTAEPTAVAHAPPDID